MRKCRVLPGGQGVAADIQLSIESNFPLRLNQSCLLCLFLICIVSTLKTPSFSVVRAHLPILPVSFAPPRPLVAHPDCSLSVGRQQSSQPSAITPGHMTSVTIRQCLTALGVLIYLISNQLACYNWMQLPFTERERGGQLVEVINPG